MKTKKIPMRMCAVTRERFEKQNLIRVVKTPEGNVEIDPTGKLNGRGVYLKKDLEVMEKASKRNVLSKVFDIDIDKEIYEELKKYINI
ncbi:MAG: YlxR family protein [bacterium]